MAVCEIHLGSGNALHKSTSFMALLPEVKHPGPFPVFYLLHGLSDNHTTWVRRTSVERYMDGWPMIVVMPNGERSFYTDAIATERGAYETLVIQNLIGFVDQTFNTIPARQGRVIGGLSMGGYGALKLALKHPDKFCAAVSHSGAVSFATDPPWADEDRHREFAPIFGEKPRGGPEDIFALVENADRATLPAMRIDCGTEDFLIEHNRKLHAHLEKLKIPHEYEEFPGGHAWAYWDTHVQEAILFFTRHLGLKKVTDDG